MKKNSLVVLLCIALALGTIGCSNESKISTKKTKTAATNNSQISPSKNQQEVTFKRDINKDGAEENIKVIFKCEVQEKGLNDAIPIRAQSYEIDVTSGDKHYTYEAKDVCNVIPEVKFADFDTKDKYIEFYINSEGPSDDPSSAIFRFDNNDIKKICDTVGYIKEYDREGKIYTDFSKTYDKYAVALSYYDINKGKVQYLNKNNLIGKKLQYDNSLILFTDYTDKSKYYKSYIDDNSGKEEIQKVISNYSKDSIVKVCDPNEVLTITDIDNTYHGLFKEGKERNIRVKVKTSDGKEGWLEWLNGGD